MHKTLCCSASLSGVICDRVLWGQNSAVLAAGARGRADMTRMPQMSKRAVLGFFFPMKHQSLAFPCHFIHVSSRRPVFCLCVCLWQTAPESVLWERRGGAGGAAAQGRVLCTTVAHTAWATAPVQLPWDLYSRNVPSLPSLLPAPGRLGSGYFA